MLTTRFNCPHCSKQLRLRKAPAPGRRILCSGCNRTFTPGKETISNAVVVPVEEATPLPSAIALPAALAVSAPVQAPKTVPMPETVGAGPPSLTADGAGLPMRRGILLALVVGGLLLLGGSTALALRLATRKDSRQVSHRPVDSQSHLDPAGPEHGGRSGEAPALPGGNDASRPDRPDDPGRPPPVDDHRPPRPPGGRPPSVDLPPRTDPVSMTPEAERSWLPSEMQLNVNKAIDKGVEYLKKKQLRTSSWEPRFTTAYAALPALTLLECGVPRTDPRVQKAVAFVRGYAKRKSSGKDTYELSLALLFLDRLGEAQDRKLIRNIALRLVAGQQADGGWTYLLPVLTLEEENKLEGFLEQTRPQGLDRFVQLPDGRRLDPAVLRPEGKPGPSLIESGNKPSEALGTMAQKATDRKKPLTEEEAQKARQNLPPRLREIPAVVEAAQKAKSPFLPIGGSDNSNTQFATLALWAASRHGLPLERSLDALSKRFRRTQLDNGTWKYHGVQTPAAWGTPAMTGAGLLGLAVGHGLNADVNRKEKLKDAQVEKGLRALAVHVGKPFGDDRKGAKMPKKRLRPLPNTPIDMYFLWTVERVGVLYGARTIDGKDWYRWGVELLLAAQTADGSWKPSTSQWSNKTLDTCLALLFLKRANFAVDLTRKLEFVIDGKRASGSASPP